MSKNRVRNRISTLLAAALLATAGSEAGELRITDRSTGDGAEAIALATVKVHYTGWLLDGTQFDSSRDRGEPIEFVLGAGQVIPGWEQGLLGMRVGGERELEIPPELAYGKRGAGDVIPPDATLRFEVALLDVVPPKFSNIDNAGLERLRADGVKLIDIRRPEEWRQTGVVDGSILMTAFDERGRLVRDFPQQLAETVATDEPFMLICRTGNRTAALARALTEQAGYTQVYNVTRGITDWIGDKRPVAKGG